MSEQPFLDTKGSSFDDFHGRHRDDKGKRLGWMIDFYRAKEGVIYHRGANLKWRVLELAKKTSWGNDNRDYPADENGNPLTQRDFARILDVDYKRVSEAVEELIDEGYMRREGRVMFVIDDPAAARKANKRTTKVRNGRILGEERAKFITFWQSRNPEQFQRYQKIGEEIEEKFREQREAWEVAWNDYQESQRKSGTDRTNDPEDPERDGQNVRNGTDKTSATERTEAEPILNGFTSTSNKLASSKDATPESLVEEAVGRSKFAGLHLPGNRATGIRNAAAKLAGLPPEPRIEVLSKFEEDCRVLASRRENKPKSWGIIVTVMEDAITAVREQPRRADESPAKTLQESIPTVEEQIRLHEELLEFYETESPSSSQSLAIRTKLEQLRSQAIARKPADSETTGSTKKASSGE